MNESLNTDSCRIVVMDDDELNLVVVRQILESAGFGDVETIENRRLSQDRVAGHRADIVLVGVHGPHHHGFDVLARLQAVRVQIDHTEFRVE